jgi:hypothetical protein
MVALPGSLRCRAVCRNTTCHPSHATKGSRPPGGTYSPGQSVADNLLRLGDDGVEVGLALEALGENLVEVPGA